MKLYIGNDLEQLLLVQPRIKHLKMFHRKKEIMRRGRLELPMVYTTGA